MDQTREQIWKHRKEQLDDQHLLRRLKTARSVTPEIADNRIAFCSNDYLGLSGHPKVVAAAVDDLQYRGIGAGASRLVSGNDIQHNALEAAFSSFVGQPDAVMFPSGYQANVGTIGALTQAGDQVFSDERCHASIIDGCRLSKASVHIFKHNDMAHLDALLRAHRGSNGVKLIVTEAIFSMDGDKADLTEIHRLANAHGGGIYLDEAHSLGIEGPNGRGLAQSLNLPVDITVGTFGKAIGVSGAAIATSVNACALIKSRARSLMYTTAPPPALSAAVKQSLDMLCTGELEDRRGQLTHNISFFRQKAKEYGLPLLASDTPIQPIVVGDADATMDISNRLWDDGIFVQGIRPPTVPANSSRLRITLTCLHTESQIELLILKLTKARTGVF